ncbi:MAG TPA: bifunctional 2-polyprenyl-6-hydroxyphenol methylase/3-demethylubiquinol 3-O-methyltransferase UbiG [Polyangiaceae bacterium]
MATVTNSFIDNQCFESLGEDWYSARDNPIGLLRAEARFRNPWLDERIRKRHGPRARVLDIGCGGGFLSNDLGRNGFVVTGVDMSESALNVARAHDENGCVRYVCGDACRLPFADSTFDVVCMMDFLEHVESPSRVIEEASRVLVTDGSFFFHTFNRNRLAWLVAIKGVEWFVRNTPPRLHVLEYFIKPDELRATCSVHGLRVEEVRGVGPALLSGALVRLLLHGTVSDDFRFEFKKSTMIGYMGHATRVR